MKAGTDIVETTPTLTLTQESSTERISGATAEEQLNDATKELMGNRKVETAIPQAEFIEIKATTLM